MTTTTKRDDILNCASKLFNHYGFKAVGIDRIIEDSKVAKKTLYHHFSSKDEIILAVLDKMNHTLEHEFLLPLELQKSTPEKKLKKLVDSYGAWFRSEEFYGCPFHKAMAEFPEKDHPVNLRVKCHHDLLLHFIKKTVKSRSLASKILLVLEGSVIKAKIASDPMASKEAWIIISQLLKA